MTVDPVARLARADRRLLATDGRLEAMVDAKRPYRRLVTLLGAATAGVILNCSSSDSSPCYGVVVGDKLDITIVDTYDMNSQYSWLGGYPAECGFGFDLTQGQVLHATVDVGTRGCLHRLPRGFPEFASFDGWVWTPTPPGEDPRASRCWMARTGQRMGRAARPRRDPSSVTVKRSLPAVRSWSMAARGLDAFVRRRAGRSDLSGMPRALRGQRQKAVVACMKTAGFVIAFLPAILACHSDPSPPAPRAATSTGAFVHWEADQLDLEPVIPATAAS